MGEMHRTRKVWGKSGELPGPLPVVNPLITYTCSSTQMTLRFFFFGGDSVGGNAILMSSSGKINH